MKKNTMMRIASAMLVLALLTTCVISGTFARYTTAGSKTDSARVAKWGVEIHSSGDSAFKTEYDGSVSVASGDTSNLVAPGTKNETGNTITITGTPEVKFEVKYTMTVTSDVKLPAADATYLDYTTANTEDKFDLADDYYPVFYTVTAKIGSTGYTKTGTLAEIADYINNTIPKATYNPNTTVAANDFLKLTWAWGFNGNDKADTFLGNIAAGKATATGASTNISYTITMTATQID